MEGEVGKRGEAKCGCDAFSFYSVYSLHAVRVSNRVKPPGLCGIAALSVAVHPGRHSLLLRLAGSC